jgi:hypothetical protein
VGFVVEKVALGQVFSKYFGFPCQSSFHHLLHNHPHLSSGAGTIGQTWPQYKGLGPNPLAIIIEKKTAPCLFLRSLFSSRTLWHMSAITKEDYHNVITSNIRGNRLVKEKKGI